MITLYIFHNYTKWAFRIGQEFNIKALVYMWNSNVPGKRNNVFKKMSPTISFLIGVCVAERYFFRSNDHKFALYSLEEVNIHINLIFRRILLQNNSLFFPSKIWTFNFLNVILFGEFLSVFIHIIIFLYSNDIKQKSSN